MNSKREAEDEIRAAYSEIEEHDKEKLPMVDNFAKRCHEAHAGKFLSDGEISRVIDEKLSRARIQQIRKKVESS